MLVEIYYSPYCPHCRGARDTVDRTLASLGLTATVEERNVLDHLDAAVAAGVRMTPSLAVNGRVAVAGPFDPDRVAAALRDGDR